MIYEPGVPLGVRAAVRGRGSDGSHGGSRWGGGLTVSAVAAESASAALSHGQSSLTTNPFKINPTSTAFHSLPCSPGPGHGAHLAIVFLDKTCKLTPRWQASARPHGTPMQSLHPQRDPHPRRQIGETLTAPARIPPTLKVRSKASQTGFPTFLHPQNSSGAIGRSPGDTVACSVFFATAQLFPRENSRQGVGSPTSGKSLLSAAISREQPFPFN
ncbi:unnamed protein product [Arctogadus glacialis]